MAHRVVRESKFILASVAANNNKFWTIKLLDNNELAVVFGRVGTNGAVKTWQHSSRAEADRDFERKCQAKLTGGYRVAKVLVGDHTAVRSVFKDTLADLAVLQLCPPPRTTTPPNAAGDGSDAALAGGLPSVGLAANTAAAGTGPTRGAATGVGAGSGAVASGSASAAPGGGGSDAAAATAASSLLTSVMPVATTQPHPAIPATTVQAPAPPSPSASAPADSDAAAVARLVRHLVERNTHDILSRTSLTYDEAAGSFRTPLGIVDQDAVDEARAVLAAIADVVAGRAASTGWEALVERYMMLIPRDIGRHRPTLASLFPDLGAVHAQTGVLDSLEASIRAVKASMRASRAPAAAASTAIGSNGGGGGDGVAAGGSAQSPRIFNAALRPVADAALCDSVGALFREGLNVAHSSQSLRLHRVFDVRIDAMAAAFADTAPRVGNVRRLWHGTRASNVLSILQGGMVVPPSTSSFVTGRLYGDGLYFSDQSTKALNYAIGRAPGQRVGAADDARATGSFMFLCDVALGRAYTPQGRGGDRYPVAGYDSTYARGGVSGVLNNEMIVYATAQANPLYLCEFRDADHLR